MLRIGKRYWPLCAGNHKSPIFGNMRVGLSDCRKRSGAGDQLVVAYAEEYDASAT